MEETSSNTTNSIIDTPVSKEFLEKILNKEISTLEISAGTNPGDNYSSNLLSFEVALAENPEKPLHLLIKTFPNNPTRQNIFKEFNVFLKEHNVYDIWLKELSNFQKRLIGNGKVLIPALPELVAGAAIDYKSDSKNWEDKNPVLHNYLLMVDARKTYGFKLANKLKSLEYQQVKVVMEELAKYHALSHAYRVHNKLSSLQSKFPFLEDSFIRQPHHRSSVEAMFKVNMQLIKDTCQDFFNERPEIAESFGKLLDPAVPAEYLKIFLDPEGMDEKKVESFMRVNPEENSGDPLQDQWIVVSHGDCWTNNMLFKTDDNGDLQVLLVDLPAARETCVMTDLVYFFYTSTDTAFRKRFMNEMLEVYHKYFVKFCDISKVDPFPGFTFENFQRKFQRSKIFGFLFASIVLPIILQKPETTLSLDNVEMGGNRSSGDGKNETDEYIAAMFQKMGRDKDDQNMLRDRLVELLEELYEEGVF